MSIFLIVLGTGLILCAFIDALWTTLWVDGNAGPLSARITTWSWRGALALIGRDRHKALSLFGPFILAFVVLLWIALLWLGWTLLYAGDPSSLLHATTKEPADLSGRFYFVGYMLFTAGNGDYTPNGDTWQVLASLTNMSGMLLATLAITYLLSVVSAVVQKRAFASQVAGLGSTASEIVKSGWNGKDLAALDLPLNSLSSELSQLSERYLAYPVLQYYHAAKPKKSPVIAAARLDEALTIMRFGVPEEHRPSPAVLGAARSSVRSFLDTLPSAFIHPAPQAPPEPDLAAVADAGVPTVPPAEFTEALKDLSHRRRELLGLVSYGGWEWEDGNQ